MTRIRLEREGARVVEDPSCARVKRELEKLRSYGPSAFASLTRSDGSYVQVAGGGVGCMLEWRDALNQKHYRGHLGEPQVPFPDGAPLTFTGGSIPLRRDEWFRIDQVSEVFCAFLDGKSFPSFVQWREISELFELPAASPRT